MTGTSILLKNLPEKSCLKNILNNWRWRRQNNVNWFGGNLTGSNFVSNIWYFCCCWWWTWWRWIFVCGIVSLFPPSAMFHIETSHLLCSAKQITCFYMKRNFGLEWLTERSVLDFSWDNYRRFSPTKTWYTKSKIREVQVMMRTSYVTSSRHLFVQIQQ